MTGEGKGGGHTLHPILPLLERREGNGWGGERWNRGCLANEWGFLRAIDSSKSDELVLCGTDKPRPDGYRKFQKVFNDA